MIDLCYQLPTERVVLLGVEYFSEGIRGDGGNTVEVEVGNREEL